jgi:hypothetical protein
MRQLLAAIVLLHHSFLFRWVLNKSRFTLYSSPPYRVNNGKIGILPQILHVDAIAEKG